MSDMPNCIIREWARLSPEEKELLEKAASLHQRISGIGDGDMPFIHCGRCNKWIPAGNMKKGCSHG